MRKSFITLAALGAALLVRPVHGGPILGTNWVVNGNAESGAGSADGSVVAVPGWTAVSPYNLFTAVQYENTEGNFPSLSDPGPPSRGANFFAGGPNIDFAAGSQTLNVSSLAAAIDQGNVSFTLSGYLGGWQDQDDSAAFYVDFYDASSGALAATNIQGPLAAGRGSQTGLLYESTTGIIPVGTRSVYFELDLSRVSGSYDDGYADNLSFVATQASATAPEPASVICFCMGAIALAGLKRAVR